MALIAFLSAGNIFGQNVKPSENDTTDKVVKLKDVVVSSLKLDKKIVETPANLSIVNSSDYKKHSSFTVADVLKFEPGISMGGDGIWATNVNVRGLSENRLVTLIDGNRVETANDLTASLSMIDVNDIGRVEVIKGAQSSLYGSGAMGGIVNIITKDGYFSDKAYFHGNAISSYSTVNNYYSEYLSLNTGSKKWYLRVNGSYGKAGNTMTPEGILENSGFTTNNIGAKFGFKPAKNHLLKIQFQRNWSTDVGIPGGDAFPGPATAKYKDIGRVLFNGSYEIKNITDNFVSLKLNVFDQNITRNVEMIPNTKTTTTLPSGITQITIPELITPNGLHHTYGAQLQGVWKLSDNNTLIAGLDAWRRDIQSTRTKYITILAVKPNGDTIVNKVERGESPFPNASFTSAGVFAQDETHIGDRFTLTVGGRLDGIFVTNEECYDVNYIIKNGQEQPLTTQRITFAAGSNSDLSWSGNIGLLYKIAEKTDLVMNMARSYRAPSLEERFKYIDLGNYVRLGNPNLKAEEGYSADLGVRYWGDKFDCQASVFANRITNMIVESPGIFVYQLTEDSSFDTVPALINSNVSKALLYGAEFNVNYDISNRLQAFATGTYVVGLDTENDTYLPQIPPMSGRLGLAYSQPGIGTVGVSLLAASAKPEDAIAEGEDATDGYCRLDMSLNTRLFHFGPCGLQFFGGIDNITNETYTNFLSTNRGSISVEPGRNFYIKGVFSF